MDMNHDQNAHLINAKRHGVSDEGFSINFKGSHGDDNGEGHYDDALHYFKEKDYIPSHDELEAKERELRKEHDRDAMNIRFHGMRFDFNRDQQPSHWSSQQQQTMLSPSSSTMESIVYILPAIIIGLVLSCIVCAIATVIGYLFTKWIENKICKQRKQSPIDIYKSVAVIDC